MSEEKRCQKLSKMMNLEVRCLFIRPCHAKCGCTDAIYFWKIKSSQFIQAHTILKSVAHKYADLPVLVLGGKYDVLRKVAEG